jgi:outer membrane immunogenic protein
MKRIVLGSIALSMLASSTFAADMQMPVYKAPVAVPAAWSWTGFYVGADVGGKWEGDSWTATSLADAPVGTPRSPIDTTSPRTYNTSGVRGGLYAGYNWQASQYVFGIEANGGFANANSTVAGFPGCTLAGCTVGFGYPPNGLIAGGDLTTINMRWDASLRGRLGFLATPDLLLYGTGGVAFQNISVTGACGPAANSFQCNVPQPVPSTVTVTNTLVGWTAGAGLEWHAWGNWLLRGEYRYAGFGTTSYVFPFGISNTNNTYRFNLRTQTQIATFGIAYKF